MLMPQVYTKPLTEEFVSDGYGLIKFIYMIRPGYRFHEWQEWVLIHLLERYPADWPVERLAGQLRYKQAVISVGRQNGKSEVGSALALYGMLMHSKEPAVFSIAALKDTANITYKRFYDVINKSSALQKRFKTSGHHGIKSLDKTKPGLYRVIRGDADTLNGHPTSLTIYDELHIAKTEAYFQIVTGGMSIPESMVVGITTAGDENSDLLKGLYETGKSGENERFFFAKWEADPDLPIYEREAWLMANPSMYEGKVDVDEQIAIAKTKGEAYTRRYHLNQFIAAENPWMPLNMWTELKKGWNTNLRDIVYSISVSDKWGYCSIVATYKDGETLYSELVDRIVNPDIDQVEARIMDLRRKNGGRLFVTEGSMLYELHSRLKERGYDVEHYTPTQIGAASMTAYALIANKRVIHAHDNYVKMQFPFVVAKQTFEGHAIDRKASRGSIDAVMATVIGLYAAENTKKRGPSLYVHEVDK